MDNQPKPRKKTVRYILVFLFTLLGVALLLRYLTPAPKPTEVIVKNNTAPLPSTYPSIAENVVLEKRFTPPNTPLTLRLATASATAFPIEQFKSQTGVIDELSSVAWSNLDQTDFIMYDKYLKKYEYTSPKSKKATAPINLSQSMQKASLFFSEYGVTTLTPILDSIQYFTSNGKDSEFNAATEKTGTVVKIPFSPSFSGYPVYLDNHSLWSAEVFITNTGDVVKATIPATIYSFGPSDQINTTTVDDALQNIGSATITSVDDPTFADQPVENLSKISITLATLEYRLNTKTKVALPYYRFNGTGIKKDGNTLQIEFILPASNSATN